VSSVRISSAPSPKSKTLRSKLIVEGMVNTSLYPFAAAMYARPTPVLPLVGSTYHEKTSVFNAVRPWENNRERPHCHSMPTSVVLPGLIIPSLSAASIMLIAIRSLTLQPIKADTWKTPTKKDGVTQMTHILSGAHLLKGSIDSNLQAIRAKQLVFSLVRYTLQARASETNQYHWPFHLQPLQPL
jgi:hypothetical protein